MTISRIALHIGSLGFCFAIGCSGAPSQDATGTSLAPIQGGTTDNGDPSVVQLRFRIGATSAEQCTATLVAPKVLLTAAHCVPAGAYAFQYNPSADADPFDFKAPGWVNAVGGIADPAYNGDPSNGHDVGVILLGAAPAGLTPIALGPAPAAGAQVRAVGFGLSDGVAKTGTGTKREITISVTSVLPHEFVAGTDLHGTCHGDSGGPIFEGSVLVGTTSYGDTADCRQSSHMMRVDDSRDFLDLYVGAGGGNPPPGGGGGGGGGGNPPPGGGGGGGGGTGDICCYGGAFYDCATPAGCFGGFDVEACIAACTDTNCELACVQQLNGKSPDATCKPDPSRDATCH